MKKRISAPKKAAGKSNQKGSGKKTAAVKKSAAKPAARAKAKNSAAPTPSRAQAPPSGLGSWPPFRYPPA
jgi:hypothetical protein